jgi:hypothetical protein
LKVLPQIGDKKTMTLLCSMHGIIIGIIAEF